MGNKAETYLDKSGKSWLVFYDKDGDKEYDLWTTPINENKPNYRFKKETNNTVVYARFEITKFPNGFYGFGYDNNFVDNRFEKVKSDLNRRYETETICLQHALEHLLKQKIDFRFSERKIVEEFIEELKSEINPQTLF